MMIPCLAFLLRLKYRLLSFEYDTPGTVAILDARVVGKSGAIES